jgi:hypothetical protein
MPILPGLMPNHPFPSIRVKKQEEKLVRVRLGDCKFEMLNIFDELQKKN